MMSISHTCGKSGGGESLSCENGNLDRWGNEWHSLCGGDNHSIN